VIVTRQQTQGCGSISRDVPLRQRIESNDDWLLKLTQRTSKDGLIKGVLTLAIIRYGKMMVVDSVMSWMPQETRSVIVAVYILLNVCMVADKGWSSDIANAM
jgi:hypothetical protein